MASIRSLFWLSEAKPSSTSSHCFEKHHTHPFSHCLWIRGYKPGQIFSEACLLCPVLRWNMMLLCVSAYTHAVFLSVFCSPQTLLQSPCLSVLAMSPSQQGISPSMTARLLSSCLAACRELPTDDLSALLPMCSTHCTPYNQVCLRLFPFCTLFILCQFTLHLSDLCLCFSISSYLLSWF